MPWRLTWPMTMQLQGLPEGRNLVPRSAREAASFVILLVMEFSPVAPSPVCVLVYGKGK